MVPGTLRDQFLPGPWERAPGDERIRDVLRKVGLEGLVERLGGLDAEHDWGATLSLGEQQLIAFARLLLAEPDFAFLDEAASALGEARRAEVYRLLAGTGISYISVGDRQPSVRGSHGTILEIRPDGSWSAEPVPPEEGRAGS